MGRNKQKHKKKTNTKDCGDQGEMNNGNPGEMNNGNPGEMNNSDWLGKHHVLVTIRKHEEIGKRTEFCVVNLKTNEIETKHPGVVWSNLENITIYVAALDKDGTNLSVLNVGLHEFENPTSPQIKQEDYICRNLSDTCISTLDLTKAPLQWSNWTAAPKMNVMRCNPVRATLGNKIFIFPGSLFGTVKPEVYEIGTDKWEELSTQFDRQPTVSSGIVLPTHVISDPKEDRLIAFLFNIDSIYAYYPNENDWKLLHENIDGSMFFGAILANEVVDNVVYMFFPYDKEILGYDFLTNKFLRVSWSTEHGEVLFTRARHLLYLGENILCLAYWYTDFSNKRRIMFHRFSVERFNGYARLTHLSARNDVVIGDVHYTSDTYIPF